MILGEAKWPKLLELQLDIGRRVVTGLSYTKRLVCGCPKSPHAADLLGYSRRTKTWFSDSLRRLTYTREPGNSVLSLSAGVLRPISFSPQRRYF